MKKKWKHCPSSISVRRKILTRLYKVGPTEAQIFFQSYWSNYALLGSKPHEKCLQGLLIETDHFIFHCHSQFNCVVGEYYESYWSILGSYNAMKGVYYTTKSCLGLYSFRPSTFNFIVIVSSTVQQQSSLMGPTSPFLGPTRPYYGFTHSKDVFWGSTHTYLQFLFSLSWLIQPP